ncbi:hypothetical protein A2U01_0056965, partial [Trifolium medium]|nr:hypothetical protein [Trifolium medium]
MAAMKRDAEHYSRQ